MSAHAQPVALPPRGTPARRAWFVRLTASALLPGFSVAMAVLSVRALDLAAVQVAPWGDLAGWFVTGLIVAGVFGIVCLFQNTTRVVGAFAVAVAVFGNPFAFALALGAMGLA
jgi:hypothetical protein